MQKPKPRLFTAKRAQEIITQVFRNPQVSFPPLSYQIKDLSEREYESSYIDLHDLTDFIDRLETHLKERFK